jgi:aminoglycoside phosphotransferase (APT) family kinase protein
VEYLPGAPDFAPADPDAYLAQLAGCLASIHAVDVARFDLAFLPSVVDRLAQALAQPPEVLDDSLSEGDLRAALASAAVPADPGALLHGDFWPGNVLWQAGRLVGVIDWEDAMLGDPLADAANARLEVLWALGAEAMEAFTQHYLALTGRDPASLPYWDLAAALRPAGKLATWGLPADKARHMRQAHRWFVREALDRLPRR